jgi:anaerobic glycerol-3-phosphate dehydrogenase
VPAGETIASLAGPQGLRLDRRIRGALEEAGCTVRSARVARVGVEGDTMQLALEGGEELDADAVVLATGKLVGGGVELRGGRMRETLAGLPVYADGRSAPMPSSPEGPDPVLLFGDDPFHRGPGFRYGAGYDAHLRALGPEGRVVSANLFVAGALLDGFDPSDGTGLGCCATTGWIAGRGAAA